MSGGDDDALFGLVLRGRAIGSLLQTLSDRWLSFCSLPDRNTLSCFLNQQMKRKFASVVELLCKAVMEQMMNRIKVYLLQCLSWKAVMSLAAALSVERLFLEARFKGPCTTSHWSEAIASAVG
ncbi:hypothetical protein AOLI_G00225650 [Acnodon oligacanthus]